MATKQSKQQALVTVTPQVGPGVIRWCARCGKAIKAGEHWRKVSRGGLAVGVHDACMTGEVTA